jgi:hypothetical protein
MGLMMVLAGLAVLAMAFGSATVHGMRHLEDELEDHEEGVGGSGGPG